MAASATLTAAQAELISSLSRDDIPIKLRCAVCSRLAVNAFRLPCCDQAICETCQSTIQPTCPVCEHNPVSAGDCKPHKSLRTTIRVFLRTAEKKREALRAKDTPKETPPATPSTPNIAPVIPVTESNNAPATDSTGETKDEIAPPVQEPVAETVGSAENVPETPAENPIQESTPNGDQQDIPHQSIEEIAPGQERSADAVDADEPKKDSEEKRDQDAVMAGQVGPMGQMPGFGAGFGFDAMGGGFPGMGVNGQPDLNQMQQMQMMMMQNGMGNGFGGFPMMAAPGMMDPMTMQNMMMGGGFGMGANGMNGMNMGMGGMGGGFDGGMNNGFNGWNNQQSWNGGQDNNFNQGNASGMGAADFSANNSGYHHNAAGYNQGNYGRNQHNDFQRGFQRNRGRGGRHHGFQGRGAYGSNMNENFSQQFPQHGQKAVSLTPSGPVLEGVAIPTGPKADTVASAPAANVDEFGREVREVTESKELEESTEKADAVKDEAAVAEGDAAQVVEEPPQNEEENASAEKANGYPTENIPKPILTLEEIEKSQQFPPSGPYTSVQSPMGPPASRGRHGSSSSHNRGHGGPTSWQHNAGPAQSPVVPVVPLNAPTGPKAMREGLPNTSLRGRGFSIAGRGGVRATSTSLITPTEPSGNRTPRNDKDRSRSRSRSKSRSPSRSRSNERRSDKHRSRRHRHRSTSISEETDEERKRRRERRRKYDEKYGSDGKDDDKASKDGRNGAEEKSSRDAERVEKSRSASPDSRRSSHRSRRDREKERDHKSSSSRHHSSREHRSHRDRSRDRGRSKDRERSRDREHRHRREKEKYHDERHQDDKYQEEKYQEDRDGDEPASAVESIAPKEANDRVPETPTSQGSGLEIRGSHRRSLREVEEKERNSNDQRSGRQHRIEDEIKIPSGPRGMREQEEKRASRSARFDPSSSNHNHRFSSSSQREKDHSSGSGSHRERERERDRDRDSRSSLSKISAPKGPRALESHHHQGGIDPHTAEREARNRERLMKEAQRMAGLSSMMGGGGGGRKRSRDDIAGGGDSTSGRGRKNRRRGGFGGDGVDEGDEERIARLEEEREAR